MERESSLEKRLRQDAEKEAVRVERQVRLGHISSPPASKPKTAKKSATKKPAVKKTTTKSTTAKKPATKSTTVKKTAAKPRARTSTPKTK